MPELIAIAYADETVAGQAAEELERRSGDLPIDPDAIGAIVCERDGGRCQLTTSRHPGATAAWSKFWGALLGVVMGECEIKDMLKPGTSVLFIVVGRVSPELAIDALSHYGGTALKCSLEKDGLAELRDALDGEHAAI